MSFTTLGLSAPILRAIKEAGYTEPTPIQKQAIPHLLKGRDLLGLAQTGTGKTAAFVLPTLHRLQKGHRRGLRALILTPTRELAQQIHENIQQMAGRTGITSCTIFGGVSKSGQIRSLRRGADIAVACPGRLLDHLNAGSIDPARLEVLILDEADSMFDRGFLPDIRRIMKYVPAKRQSMVFSATMPGEIRHLVEEILSDHVTVQVDHERPAATISHVLFEVAQNRKTSLLKKILHNRSMTATLVFTRTKHKARALARQLGNAGFMATSLQGNMSQNQRTRAMNGFRSGKFTVMVATDIAARGIDVTGISHVINYDMPDTAEAYTHRTGRTGRAERTGVALSFVTADDRVLVRQIERGMGAGIPREKLEGFDAGATDEKSGRSRRAPSGRGGGRNPAGRKPASRNQRRTRRSTAKVFDFAMAAAGK